MYFEYGKTRAAGVAFIAFGIVLVELYHIAIISGRNIPWSIEQFVVSIFIGGSVIGIFVALGWCVIELKGYKVRVEKKPVGAPRGFGRIPIPTCGICLGTIKKGEPVAVCTNCRKVYHKSCAERVKFCPACAEGTVIEARK